ncbi:LANO_0E09406g1_1 [Lachancea nothofagi CBS 11611]|uniref:Exonuclease V, mitochondrial n=1 Tax=Lachancea nothofagi CBS 11611 TaxID=1266666 RepID=A0A1G4JVY5_9SACH|nr:LANO_0E09406g1_1 [Lachancea nothofagi CBS 11611]
MRFGPLATARRFIQIPRISRLTGLNIPDERLAPTKEELDIIDQLPFFQKEFKPTNRSITKAKRAYLDKKLPIVRQLFPNPQDEDYLSYKIPENLPNPFLDAYARATTNPVTGTVEYDGTPRLSVTKLLTKRWCELRETYDIYSQVPIFEHGRISRGRREHQKLEDDVHLPLQSVEEFKAEFEIDIPDDAFHTLVEDWFQTMTRLLTLFQKGQAREILCHGYLSSKACRLLDGSVKDEEDVLISGIIDHLILKKRDAATLSPTPLKLNLSSAASYDLRQILEVLPQLVQDASQELEVIVSDVKTRSTKTIPQQQTVISASKTQVMYYRYFLENLSSNADRTYQKLLINAGRRGFDVDAPINPAKVIYLMEVDSVIEQDMLRLQSGVPIGFAPFDSYIESCDTQMQYTLEDFDDLIQDLRTRQKYGHLFTKWTTPVTLRYFAARLAQMYTNLSPLLSTNLMVEYYSGDVNFHNILFKYDPKELERESVDSAMFWFGKRNIEPIKPTLRNFLTYCKYCDYESVCLWKKEGKDACRSLGDDLTDLDQKVEGNDSTTTN